MSGPISKERQEARAFFPADLQTVDSHNAATVGTSSVWLAKPAGATHVKLQAIGADVRYRIDEQEATATVGFQLVNGADTLAPCPNNGVSLIAESGSATIQYQWVR